jgi:hypothetical protein
MLRVATDVQQIITELNDAVSEEDKIMAINKYSSGLSVSLHLMRMALEGSALSSAYTRGTTLGDIFKASPQNLCSKLITFIGPTSTRA